ncbi:glycoside hydrolase [Pleurotus eryngii]|uniref:Glycoside hydrolase n=1 Tax=Pleurotus eryngii TaxID=5323 RepID=A0A9P6A6P3_PLEER|nr:glycoside hydrolase [Pleurotus eryngii]
MNYRFHIAIFLSAPATALLAQPESQPSRTQIAIATGSIQDAPLTTTIHSAIPTVIPQTGAIFPPVGSIPHNFSPRGLQELWNIVGSVEDPPFTTTPVPKTPVVLPSNPPALYPEWFAPRPSKIFPDLKLPKGFKFGVATASYQVEGAAKSDGKGPSMWDWASRQPGAVSDGSNADVVDLHYFMYKEDVARIAALGVNAHSFSLSWARIFPFGVAGSPLNEVALKHYSDVIDYHLASGVEPVVTLFHWDTPLALVAYYGGFTSPKIVNDFVHYATAVFRAFNGRVKTWYTFNEPNVYCGQIASYPFDIAFSPGINKTTAPYHCAYNLLKAHAAAVKVFRSMRINGEIAFKNDNFVGMPWRANSTADKEAVERHAAFGIGIFSDPVYTTGDWPEVLKEILPPSILPRFTKKEQEDILGSADFFAIDAYRTQWVSSPPEACINDVSHPLWPACNQVVFFDSEAGWAAGPSPDPLSSWLQATPNFLRDSLKELQRRWPTKKMYIAEFGFVEPSENERQELFQITEDVARTNYFMTYLGEVLLAIHEDKLPIAGTFAWAMLDNAEWNSGLSARFGIQYVNYSSPILERVYKRSAMQMSEFFRAHLV